jgi:DNA-binding MarR family transcriptional regulator
VGQRNHRKTIATSAGGVTAAVKRLAEEHIRTTAANGYEAERLVRAKLGDRAGDLLKALPPEARARTACEVFERIEDERLTFEGAHSWLFMQVLEGRQKLEQAVQAVETGRSRGGKASTAARCRPWQLWEQCMQPHPSRDFPKFQRAVISVIQGRARGTPNEELEQKHGVPANLPGIAGKNGQPPSERSIRRHLFGAK